MSSSTPSSSHSQRTPLHERTTSEQNKLQIRLVPYTPPKIDAEETASRAPESESPGSASVSQTTKDRTSSASTLFGRDRFIGSALSSSSSSPSPVSSSTWVKGKGVSESRLVSDSSGTEHPAPPARAVVRTSNSSFIRHVNAPAQQPQGQHSDGTASSHIPARPGSRRSRVINIHSDSKTFSLVRAPTTRISTGSESTAKSRSHSNASFFSSYEGTSFEARTDDHPSSLFSSIPERSVSRSSASIPGTPSGLNDDHNASASASSSPWNYRLIGGLRKVPKTPDSKAKGKERQIPTELPPILPSTSSTARVPGNSSPLTLKPSFTAGCSDSDLDETTNYDVIGRSSPPQQDSDSIDQPPSSSSSNYLLLGQSSGPDSFSSSPTRGRAVSDTPDYRNYVVHGSSYPPSEQAVLETPGSRNFVVHSNVSPSPSVRLTARTPRSQVSNDSSGGQPSEKYSQESLVIPPLQPHRKSSSENLHLNRIQREAVHGRSNSYSSISTVLTQDTGPNVVRLAHTPSASSSLRHALWAGRSTRPPKSRMDVHQWSSQLSTVLSEYEGSDRASRMTSLGSAERGSRNIQSISSSIFDNLEPTQAALQTHSRSGSLEHPGAVFMRGARELPNPPVRTIRDHDEHGDGLADLEHIHQLQSKSSRTRLGFLSRHSSDRSSHSTASSRTGSFTGNPIPSWARAYYGSGERRWLAAPSIISEDGDSPPSSSWVPGASPAPEQFDRDIHNPRRRPREIQHNAPQALSLETSPARIGNIRQAPKKKTSSVWSPHLARDHRASRYNMWQPPSMTWSAESRVLGRRNIQLVLFVLGFIFPFAWMIAAVLPLPPKPGFDIQESEKSTARSRSAEDSGPEPPYRRVAPIDDSRYQSARWWRNLNRYMSIIGLLILGAVVALIVVGTKQGWGK
ncbi:hypothetical protein F4802DRAFT_603370 [Xylaria palmicola]|nr:hypothetical protein F4802DRAFT_603370 [Xylaria palmicola]